jgi:hypothetical protein
MPSNLSELKPYKSLLLGRLRNGVAVGPSLNGILDDVAQLVQQDPRLSSSARRSAVTTGIISAGFMHYRETRPVSWTTDESTVDELQHLVLVCRRSRLVAIYASDSRFRGQLAQRFSDSSVATGLGTLDQIDSGVINAAFVRGATRTLWLSGTHRRTTVKADSKILSGVDLRDALDPLDDQSYYFSAARSQLDFLDPPVGVAPRRSSLWAGTTKDWADFRDSVAVLLDHLEAVTEKDDSPLPILVVEATNIDELADAFDVNLQPPELLSDDPTIDAEEREEMERWALRARFEIESTAGSDFAASVFLDDSKLGTLNFSVDLSETHRVRWQVVGEPSSLATGENFEQAKKHCGKVHWLTIRYDSGHSISDGTVFLARFRDTPFQGFRWATLEGINVKQEKPNPLSSVGSQSSLFDWVQRHWPNIDGSNALPGGWLACDDGAMELADFIHLDESTSPPTLTHIHVKAAHNASPARQISVSPYEIVVAQAVKNLRHFDRSLLAEGLASGLHHQVGKLVWNDRELTTRIEMIAALEALGSDYQRQLVVLQPHVTKTRYDQARLDSANIERRRLQQLDTLLLAADADAHSLGARFLVIAENV